ncbi:hypothetical protein ABT024_10970 [Streptomyces sp. NPDC002812]|uniref:helix-turn-helix transcriptional regulator n=1 Tax=unclassified Streptomyces TaxID=2593676 RepID=UPI00332732B6
MAGGSMLRAQTCKQQNGIEQMTESTEPTADLPDFGASHIALYSAAIERGHFDPEVGLELGMTIEEAQRTAAELTMIGLLREDSVTGAVLPSTPETAAAHVVGPIDAAIREHRRRAQQAEACIDVFRTAYQEARRVHRVPDLLEKIESLAAIRSTLDELSEHATVEISASHPVLPPKEALQEGLERTLEALQKGLTMRTVYPHGVLAHTYMRRHLEQLTEAGAQIRTVSHVTSRIIFFDRETAVLPTPGAEPTAAILRESSVVAFLYRAWESNWETAFPFDPMPGRLGYGQTNAELKRAILRLLDRGFKDEVVARRLGMSVRACRRHIAEIMEELGASSRFQAGSQAQLHNWLETSDFPGADSPADSAL